MPVEETENEIRVRVRNPGDFQRIRQMFPTEEDMTEEHKPYNSEGIRGIGGPLKRTGKIEIQAYLFSKKERYGWTPAKAEKWVRDRGETPKGISYPIDPIPFNYDFRLTAVKSAMEIPKQDKVDVEEGVEVIYIEGMASTDDVDRTNDSIEQRSIETQDFEKNPVLLYNHNPEWEIGKVVRLESNVDLGDGRHGLFCRAAVIGATEKAMEVITKIKNEMIKAFSINGRARARKRVCEKGTCFHKLMGLNLAEISVVAVPANQESLFQVAKGLLPPDITDQSPGNAGGAGGAETHKEEKNMSSETEKKAAEEAAAAAAAAAAAKQDPAAEASPELLQRLEAVEAAVKKIPEMETKLNAIMEKLDAMAKANEPEEKKLEPGDVIQVGDPVKKSLFVVQKAGADKKSPLDVKKMDLEQKKQLATQQWEEANR